MKDWKKEVADRTETSGFFLTIKDVKKELGITNKNQKGSNPLFKNKNIMKVLKSSHYNNKEVINHLKSSFSILESTQSTFNTSEFLEVEKVSVFKKDDVYNVELYNIKSKDLCSKWSEKKQFTSRTKAIKFILLNIGVINKKEYDN